MKHLIYFCLPLASLFASPLSIVKPIEQHTKAPLSNIDQIYLINLEDRKEKYEICKKQLDRFQLEFTKVNAVNGWKLLPKDLEKIGIVFDKKMIGKRWATQFQDISKNQKSFVFLNKDQINKTIFSQFVTPGSIGCFLSHLTVIKDAFDQGYTRILVLEDDFQIVENPYSIPDLTKKLDRLVGHDNWDVLHLDFDQKDAPLYHEKNDFLSPLNGLDLAWFWRPDITLCPQKIFYREPLDSEFLKLGSRMRTHAMIVNRSGMEKILNFYVSHGHYVPVDHEMALIPDLKLFSLTYDLITFNETVSDTKGNNL